MAVRRFYFASANTCEGFVSYFNFVLRDAERVYIIKGGPGCGKSTFFKRAGNELYKEGFDVDFIYCSADMDSLDGIFIKDINVAIVDGTAPHVIDPVYPGAVERILNFGEYWDIDVLRKEKWAIKALIDSISKDYEAFYIKLAEAKKIHDKWEREYLIGMDFNKADSMTRQIIGEVINTKTDKSSRVWHRFSGAMTPQGHVSCYNSLLEGLEKRYVVKGRPGTGKSEMTKKIAEAALGAGLDVEYYHCAFDPSSIDMIIIPELSFGLADGTAPHVLDPAPGDRLVDMFTCIDPSIVHEDGEIIKGIEKEYTEKMAEAKEIYDVIKLNHDELEKHYMAAMDFNEVDALRIRITETIKGMKR